MTRILKGVKPSPAKNQGNGRIMITVLLLAGLRPGLAVSHDSESDRLLEFIVASAEVRATEIKSYRLDLVRSLEHGTGDHRKGGLQHLTQIVSGRSIYSQRMFTFGPNDSTNDYEAVAVVNANYSVYWPRKGNALAYIWDHKNYDISTEAQPHLTPINNVATVGRPFHFIHPATLLLEDIKWAEGRKKAGDAVNWNVQEVNDDHGHAYIVKLSYRGMDYMEYRISPDQGFHMTHAIMFDEVLGERRIRQYFRAKLSLLDSGVWAISHLERSFFEKKLSLTRQERAVLEADGDFYSDEFAESIARLPFPTLAESFDIRIGDVNTVIPDEQFEWTAIHIPDGTQIFRYDESGNLSCSIVSDGKLLPEESLASGEPSADFHNLRRFSTEPPSASTEGSTVAAPGIRIREP